MQRAITTPTLLLSLFAVACATASLWFNPPWRERVNYPEWRVPPLPPWMPYADGEEPEEPPAPPMAYADAIDFDLTGVWDVHRFDEQQPWWMQWNLERFPDTEPDMWLGEDGISFVRLVRGHQEELFWHRQAGYDRRFTVVNHEPGFILLRSTDGQRLWLVRVERDEKLEVRQPGAFTRPTMPLFINLPRWSSHYYQTFDPPNHGDLLERLLNKRRDAPELIDDGRERRP